MKDKNPKWIDKFKLPLIIAGPCSAESKEQVLQTAKEIKNPFIQVFRSGIWKPRTSPTSFQGVGESALDWLIEARKQTGLLLAIEVAHAHHIKEAIKYDIDILWIGARSTTNPFILEEIANLLENTSKIILIKNPIHPDLDAWIGAIERFDKKGIKNIGVIHRGFFTHKESSFYRNPPFWSIALAFKKKYPEIPILCDISHICGNRDYLLHIAKKAIALNYDGFMIEAHIQPENALSDAQQQITPKELEKLLEELLLLYNKRKEEINHNKERDEQKRQMDDLTIQLEDFDHSLLSTLKERIRFVNKEKGADIKKVLSKNYYKKLAKEINLSENFITSLLEQIGNYSKEN